MKTGPAEEATSRPEGGPAPGQSRPADPNEPGDGGGRGRLPRRALVRARTLRRGVAGLRRGAGEPDHEAQHGLDAYSDTDAYRAWLSDRAQAAAGGPGTGGPGSRAQPGPGGDGTEAASPTISVIVPVFRPELWYLQRCVDSVRNQRYAKWELCLCDDASGTAEIERFLTDAAAGDRRVKVAVRRANGGISRASNTALALAGGDFVALLDHDDELAPDALALVARHAMEQPGADVIYSDEDKIDHDGRPCFPTFKPDWSPDLLLSYPYLGHLTVVRRRLVEEIGGFRPEMDGSQDFDLMLRATERGGAVVHIPKVLYHWRMVEGSAAGDPDAKPWAYDASRRALEDALVRRGINGHVEAGPFPGAYHTRRTVQGSSKVSVVIPLRGPAPMLRACVESMSVDPGYRAFEVVLVDDDSVEPEARAVAEVVSKHPGVRVVGHPGPYNWSAVCNVAAASCDGDMLLFLDSDVVATGSSWMGALVEQAQRPEVGAVGCRLLYPDGRLQHAGVVLGMYGLTGFLMEGLPRAWAGYMGWAGVVRECSAVSGACMMCRRDVFEELGGFDETFAHELGDVDFCLRLQRAGYRVIFTPHAELVHHGPGAMGAPHAPHDRRAFLDRWIDVLRRGDPFYNENLSRFGSYCPIRPVGEDRQWEELLSGLVGPQDD